MTRLSAGLFACGLFLSAGCVTTDVPISPVPGSAFGFAPTPTTDTKVNYAPPALDTAARVDEIGNKLRIANPQLAFQPQYLTIGSPQPEIFHRGASEILITEGLAKECKTDAQLAAVLSMELGKIVAERMMEPGATVREDPPIELRVGNDGGGSFGDADQLRRAEMATFKKQERQRMRQAASIADPRNLAVGIMQKAGYTPADVDSVSKILDEAGNNRTLAKQVLNAPPLKVN
ncbi:hypothetical protein BH10PLA2_BH10PLA2_21850 [soil metagenome]